MLFYIEKMLFLHHVVCHLMGGAEIWHHVAYVSSIYSCLWQQLDLALLGSRYIITTMMPTH
jgi:hypothetical protein